MAGHQGGGLAMAVFFVELYMKKSVQARTMPGLSVPAQILPDSPRDVVF